jgi:hypothetical protein
VRVIIAAITWTALALQLALSIRIRLAGGGTVMDGLVTYFGYFTITTNLFVALVLTVPAAAPTSRLGRFFSRAPVALSAAASIVMVSLAYHLLLRGAWDPQGWDRVSDTLLHYVVPVLFTLYWVFVSPKEGLAWADLPGLAFYPAAYFIYAVLRGALLGKYPYFFIDVSVLGFWVSARNALGLLVCFWVVAALMLSVARWGPAPVKA